jgi:hypothetical protein
LAEHPQSASSTRQSGHTGFLNRSPTFFCGVQSSHRTILHFGHCQSVGLSTPPASRPHLEQYPRTTYSLTTRFNAPPALRLGLDSRDPISTRPGGREPFSSRPPSSDRLAFLRVVEVLPPTFPASRGTGIPAAAMDRFIEEVAGIRRHADVVLVANVKRQDVLKPDTVSTAIMLNDRAGIAAAPVIVVRDLNRPQFLSAALSAFAAGLDHLMVAWGDDYPSGATNVRDYPDLASALRDVSELRSRVNPRAKVAAPVDVESLARPGGAARARGRAVAGADILLAQPPTTDSGVFERHLSLVKGAGLADRVLLNVFHLRSEPDAQKYEALFGWRLSREIHSAARTGESRLRRQELEVVRLIHKAGLPGVYLSTRDEPGVAKTLLPRSIR